MKPRGFSLLEVILALAILTGAIAVLGELARLGLRNARIARDMTYAQLLCESKLAEILAGITPPEPIRNAPFELLDDPAELGWLYSIDLAPLEEEGLLAVRVTVAQDLPPEQHPVKLSLVRWIVDPGVQLAEQAETEQTGSESSDEKDSRK